LFTSATVYPLKEGLNSSSGSTTANGDSETRGKSRGYYWKIISHIPTEKLSSGTHSLLVKLFLLGMSLFLLAAIPSWFVAQFLVRRKLHRLELSVGELR